jgi:hypothetical protein
MVPRASGPVLMFCAPRHVFGSAECDGSRFHVLPARTHFGELEATDPVFLFCPPGLDFGGTEGVGSRVHVLRAMTHFWRYRGRPVSFSYFVLPDSFSAVPWVIDPVFMFYATGLVFDGTEAVGSCYNVLSARTHFRRYRGRPVLFSYFGLPDMFSTVPSATDHVFMFCAPGLVFDGPEGDVSCFHVLRDGTSFQRYRGRQFPFTCVACLNSFSTLSRASDPVLKFCAPRLVFDGTEGVRPCFHVLHSRSHFPWYRGRRVLFSCFVLCGTFSNVRRASGPVLMFCARTQFRRYRGRRIPFSCFERPHSFSTVPRASGPFFMFCASGLVFGGTEGVGSRFHVLRVRTHFRMYRVRPLPDSFSTVPRALVPIFMFCAPRHIFSGMEGVESRFHVLRSRTCFRRYRGCRVPFSCFARPESFSAVLRALGPVFIFCTPGHVFGDTEGVRSCFHVLRSRTHFRRYQGRLVTFSCFARPDSFSTVPRASGLVFMF